MRVMTSPLSALSESGQAAARATCRGVEAALERAHDPGVDRQPFARGRSLGGALQRLGEPQADASVHALLGLRGRDLGLGLDVDERRLLAGETYLDLAGGQLIRHLERRLREQIEE